MKKNMITLLQGKTTTCSLYAVVNCGILNDTLKSGKYTQEYMSNVLSPRYGWHNIGTATRFISSVCDDKVSLGIYTAKEAKKRLDGWYALIAHRRTGVEWYRDLLDNGIIDGTVPSEQKWIGHFFVIRREWLKYICYDSQIPKQYEINFDLLHRLGYFGKVFWEV